MLYFAIDLVVRCLPEMRPSVHQRYLIEHDVVWSYESLNAIVSIGYRQLCSLSVLLALIVSLTRLRSYSCYPPVDQFKAKGSKRRM